MWTKWWRKGGAAAKGGAGRTIMKLVGRWFPTQRKMPQGPCPTLRWYSGGFLLSSLLRAVGESPASGESTLSGTTLRPPGAAAAAGAGWPAPSGAAGAAGGAPVNPATTVIG